MEEDKYQERTCSNMKSQQTSAVYVDAVPLQETSLTELLCSVTLLKEPDTDVFPETNMTPVILCIGTDRLIGDSLGPMVGSLLTRSHCPFPVYGTLAAPVHALNLSDYMVLIRKNHPGAPVIAIDASLGPDHRIGCISLRPYGLQPGAGVHKKLDPAGDISITGITNVESLQPYLSLQTARLSTVMAMAEEICTCILQLHSNAAGSAARECSNTL